MIKFLKSWFHKRTLNKTRTAEKHVAHIRDVINEDVRWLSHDPKLAALIERYLDLTTPDWYSKTVMDVSKFRKSIDSDPAYRPTGEIVSRQHFNFILEKYVHARISHHTNTNTIDLSYAKADLSDLVNRIFVELESKQNPR